MKGLMTAILYQGWLDATFGDLEAMDWLGSDDCADYCISVNFNHNIILNWVNKTRKEWQRMDEKVISLRKRVANKFELPGFCAELLRGEDEKTLRLDAVRLISLFYSAPLAAMDQLKNIRATENIK